MPLALTMGEPAGIGPDVTLAAWVRRAAFGLPPFYCLADPGVLTARAAALGLAVRIEQVDPGKAAECFAAGALPVVRLTVEAVVEPGRPTSRNGGAVLASIERAVADVRQGAAAAIVTNPISKKVLYDAGFGYPGHTEFLGALAESFKSDRPPRPVMMLAGPDLRTVPVTVHIPLAEVPSRLTAQLIEDTARIVVEDLAARFGVSRPRLVVAGLNPHAGEGGALGGEDEAVVRPAVEALRLAGIDARGPLPADTMFHPAARAGYDAAICMYHDQALIPVKTLAFDRTVNVTLGLPFVRTSPDHGTAFDIAGSGRADPTSLAEALRLAARLARTEAGAPELAGTGPGR